MPNIWKHFEKKHACTSQLVQLDSGPVVRDFMQLRDMTSFGSIVTDLEASGEENQEEGAFLGEEHCSMHVCHVCRILRPRPGNDHVLRGFPWADKVSEVSSLRSA